MPDPVAAHWSCIVCSQPSRRAFEISAIWIRQCNGCGHQFAELVSGADHIQKVSGDSYVFGGDAGYADYLQSERLLVDRGRWYARRMARYAAPGAILDIGAAAGSTLEGFRQAGWSVHGIEPNARMAAHARDRYGLDVDAASLQLWNTSARFDLVAMLQVIAHFENPRHAIAKASSVLRPGGYLLVETWDRQSWTARLAGRSWHEYSPPSVLHWFSRDGLVRLAADVGLVPVTQGRPSKWLSAGHAKSILRRKAMHSVVNRALLWPLAAIPDRLTLPYLAEDLFWMLFRREGEPAPRVAELSPA